MILYNTPPGKVFLEMYGEMEKVNFALDKQIKKVFRTNRVAGQTKFPLVLSTTYTVPASRNRYLLWCYGEKNGTDKINWYQGAVLLLTDNKGRLQTVSLAQINTIREDHLGIPNKVTYWELCIITGHFYSRFNERAFHSSLDDPIKTIITWLGRNANIFKQLDSDQLIRVPEKYEGNSQAIQTLDGIVFGSTETITTANGLECHVNTHKTFITLGMLKPGQEGDTEDHKTVRMMTDFYRSTGGHPDKPFKK